MEVPPCTSPAASEDRLSLQVLSTCPRPVTLCGFFNSHGSLLGVLPGKPFQVVT